MIQDSIQEHQGNIGRWVMEDQLWGIGGWVIDNGPVHIVHKAPIARFSPRYLSKMLELSSFHHWTLIFLFVFVLLF